MSTPATLVPGPGTAASQDAPADPRRDVVLDRLEEQARRAGIRAVVVSDLARDLHMSTKTLYRLFPSKDAMVAAVVDRWADRLVAARNDRLERPVTAREQVRSVVHFQVEWRSRYCDEFWRDLAADHPSAWECAVGLGEAIEGGVATWLARSVRPGVDPEFARNLLVAGIERALRPDVRSGAGLTPAQAVDAAVDLWCDGALAAPDAPAD